jgi:hypothetical protein
VIAIAVGGYLIWDATQNKPKPAPAAPAITKPAATSPTKTKPR